RDHRADPPPAPRTIADDPDGRARHAGRLPPGRPHHGDGRGRAAGRSTRRPDRLGRTRAGRLPGDGRGMNALEASGLNTYYGKSHILHDVSLAVADAQVATLLGRN